MLVVRSFAFGRAAYLCLIISSCSRILERGNKKERNIGAEFSISMCSYAADVGFTTSLLSKLFFDSFHWLLSSILPRTQSLLAPRCMSTGVDVRLSFLINIALPFPLPFVNLRATLPAAQYEPRQTRFTSNFNTPSWTIMSTTGVNLYLAQLIV